jgi:archaellum component FlaC
LLNSNVISDVLFSISVQSLNDHLDQLQETLIGSINKTVDGITLQLGDVKNSLTEIENKTSDITLEFNKVKEHNSLIYTSDQCLL